MRRSVLVLAALLTAAGCSSTPSDGDATAPPQPSSSHTGPGRPTVPASAKVVSYRLGPDRVVAALYRGGPDAVVLGHMGRSDSSMDDWAPVATALQEAGFTVLTPNRRGVCDISREHCSSGADDLATTWQDSAAAVRHLRSQGARRVVLGGASIGAMAAFDAARRGVEVDGLVWFAGLVDGEITQRPAAVRRLRVPQLFLTTAQDPVGATPDTRRMARWSTNATGPVVVDGRVHGTDVFAHLDTPEEQAAADDALSAIADFVRATTGGPS